MATGLAEWNRAETKTNVKIKKIFRRMLRTEYICLFLLQNSTAESSGVIKENFFIF